MKYLSVCSGIEAASVAWHSLGWEPLAFSEIESFPRKVLAYHYPDVPLHGDFTILRDQDWIRDADVLVGGTPCQAFSVAGQRQSLNDDRGNLTLEFVRLADAIDNLRPIGSGSIIVWENVPGVLSVKDNAFGCFLAALVGNDSPLIPTGGKWTNAGMVMGPKRRAAWRVLDAQYFGVAQRRRRVFVVASSRDGFDPAEVLFEREGVRRNTPPSRGEGQVTPTLTKEGTGVSRTGFNEDGWYVTAHEPVVGTLTANGVADYGAPAVDAGHYLPIAFNSKDYGNDASVNLSPTLRSLGSYDANGGASMAVAQPIAIHPHVVGRSANAGPQGKEYLTDGSAYTMDSRGVSQAVAQPIPLDTMNIIERPSDERRANRIGRGYGEAGDPMFTITKGHSHAVAQPMAYASSDGIVRPLDGVMSALDSAGESRGTNQQRFVQQEMAVRRLTPRECERLQGFPDDYTAIPGGADGPRYKALGNSMAVPVMHWIGKRVDKFLS
jgi:DNA (cytosine-5)-methyltransferase 1